MDIMSTLLESVRFNVEWAMRNDDPANRPTADEKINQMTPLELLTAISEALAEQDT